jgi:hypothetical protein
MSYFNLPKLNFFVDIFGSAITSGGARNIEEPGQNFNHKCPL